MRKPELTLSLYLTHMENPHEQQFYQAEQTRRLLNRQLDHLSMSYQKNLRLHVYLFHDLLFNASEMVARIELPHEELGQSNMMVIAYDSQVKILCHPVLMTIDHLQLLKDSINQSGGYQLTLNGDHLADQIQSHQFGELVDYTGPIEVHQL